jgi:hypothetical protein
VTTSRLTSKAHEYGLALEGLAGFLALAGTPITDPERGAMLALAQGMQMDDNVPRTLAFCTRQVAARPALNGRRRRPTPVQAGIWTGSAPASRHSCAA